MQTIPEYPKSETHEPRAQCNREKIKRGSTSIYIFENHQECVDSVRGKVSKSSSDDDGVDENDSMMSADEPEKKASSEEHQCGKNVKRSADDEEEETVILVRKRGNKVFIEF